MKIQTIIVSTLLSCTVQAGDLRIAMRGGVIPLDDRGVAAVTESVAYQSCKLWSTFDSRYANPYVSWVTNSVCNNTVGNLQSASGGGSRYFDGIDDFLYFNGEVEGPTIYSSSHTICSWIKPLGSGKAGTILGVGKYNGGGLANYSIIGKSVSDGFINQYTGSPSDGENYVAQGATFSTSVWYFVAASVNASGHCSLYVDGIFQGTDTTKTYTGMTLVPKFFVGCLYWNTAPLQYSSCYVSDCLVFSTALASNQIYTIFTATKAAYK